MINVLDAFTLLLFFSMASFMVGRFMRSGYIAFILRRHEYLEQEVARLKAIAADAQIYDNDDADWWKHT